MGPEDAIKGLGEVDECYDAGKLEVNDFFNYATKSKDVFVCSTPRVIFFRIVSFELCPDMMYMGPRDNFQEPYLDEF